MKAQIQEHGTIDAVMITYNALNITQNYCIGRQKVPLMNFRTIERHEDALFLTPNGLIEKVHVNAVRESIFGSDLVIKSLFMPVRKEEYSIMERKYLLTPDRAVEIIKRI